MYNCVYVHTWCVIIFGIDFFNEYEMVDCGINMFQRMYKNKYLSKYYLKYA